MYFILRVTVRTSSPYKSSFSSRCRVSVLLNKMLIFNWSVKFFPHITKKYVIQKSTQRSVICLQVNYNVTLPVLFTLITLFSMKPPHQGALDKLNFHSILCSDKKPKMPLPFRIWLIHLAIVFKIFA